jgi:hypothetical protein
MKPFPTVKKLAIIGSAGRRDDAFRITSALYRAAYEKVEGLISALGSVDTLVSGGAAFADHLAVHLFLKGRVPSLRLYLPAHYSLATGRYVEPYRKCPGSITNHWHREFSRKCGGDSLNALRRAILDSGCHSEVRFGFDARNAGIADNADGVVALTFGAGAELKPGGSANTMGICLGKGIPTWHICLPGLELFNPATVRVEPHVVSPPANP